MGYTLIENFAAGVDRSRARYALASGTMWECINAHLTRGGDIEKRKSFVKKYSLPAGTFGLQRGSSGLIVFGSNAPPAMPAGVSYQRLQHPYGAGMTKVLSTDLFDGTPYVAAEFSDASRHHFHNAMRVEDWTAGKVVAAMSSLNGVATHLAELLQQDTAYTTTVAGSTITVEHNTANVQMAVAVSTSNGGSVNDQLITQTEVINGSPGIKEKWQFVLSGTFEAGDKFNIKIDSKNFGFGGKPSAVGTFVKTHKRKIYSPAGSILNFCGVDVPLGWDRDVDAGAGFVNMASHQSGSGDVVSLALYQEKLSIIARLVIQLWLMDNDDAKNTPIQTINQTGTRAARSVMEYGDIDVFYLADNGIRSIRARDAVNIAGVQDVGTPIDTLVQEWLKALTEEMKAACIAVVDPVDSRLWMAIGARIAVFSYFPVKKVSAWTWYEPGLTFSNFVVYEGKIYGRAGDDIYLYGGDDGETYDSSKVTAALPFFTQGKPGTLKQFTNMDIAAKGKWKAKWLTNPNKLTDEFHIGDLEGVTFSDASVPALGHFTHVAPVLTNEQAGAVSLSQLALYYDGAETHTGG